MRAILVFSQAIERADHLLRLYDLLHDTRARRVRSDWASKFKSLMHWPDTEQICRVDGLESKSILIFRESVGIDNEHFSHDYVSELLRAALVATISALDRYLHDLVVENSWKILRRPEKDIPAELKKLSLPVLATKRALERLRTSSNARPGGLVKKAIQEQLHREFTFQKPDSVIRAARMLGVKDFWREVGKRMPSKPSAEAVTTRLREIADRRNQIVHEADLILKTKAKRMTIRKIGVQEARDSVCWVRDLANAIDGVVTDAVQPGVEPAEQ